MFFKNKMKELKKKLFQGQIFPPSISFFSRNTFATLSSRSHRRSTERSTSEVSDVIPPPARDVIPPQPSRDVIHPPPRDAAEPPIEDGKKKKKKNYEVRTLLVVLKVIRKFFKTITTVLDGIAGITKNIFFSPFEGLREEKR